MRARVSKTDKQKKEDRSRCEKYGVSVELSLSSSAETFTSTLSTHCIALNEHLSSHATS